MSENNQNNLVGELINEMQRTNPPHVFNVDNNGNPSGSSQMTNNNLQLGGGGGQSQMSQTSQVNPQLQQQFMFVLQQNPQLMQMFQNPESLQQALQNPQLMMNAISQHQQTQANQIQTQAPTPPQQQLATNQTQQDDSQQEDEDEDEVNPDQMLNLQGPVQYDEDLGDVNLPQKITDKGFIEQLLDDIKGPLIATVIFILLTQSTVREAIIRAIPKIQDSIILQTLTFASLFLTLNYLAKKITDMSS